MSMEENTQLPKEVENEIKTKASFHSGHKPDEDSTPFRNGYYSGYVSGATAYAPWKMKYDELCERYKALDQSMFQLQERLRDKMGAVWVKASERLPEKEGIYKVKRFYSDKEEKAEYKGGVFTNYQGYVVCEWYDESAAGREDAVEFAKYLDEQRNEHTPEMWAEKVIWNKPTAFQEWLQYFKQQKDK